MKLKMINSEQGQTQAQLAIPSQRQGHAGPVDYTSYRVTFDIMQFEALQGFSRIFHGIIQGIFMQKTKQKLPHDGTPSGLARRMC